MIPDLESTDYEYDDEFGPMYKYLMTGDLSEDEAINKTTFLTQEQFILQNSELYKIGTRRSKNLAKLVPVHKRLCVPLKFRFVILQQMHDNVGHFSIDKIFLAISSRFYWKTIYGDVQAYVKSCETCMCTKPNYAQKAVPLHPIEPAYFPGEVISMDHKVLSRKTKEGNVGILVCADNFSGWCWLIPVPDLGAESTAYAFVRHVVAFLGPPERV